MKEIQLHEKYSMRGILVNATSKYVTDNRRPYILEIDSHGNIMHKYKVPSIIGAMTYYNDFIYVASYSSCKPHIYKLNSKFCVVNCFNYLYNIPPKFLPNEPYERYCVGIALHQEKIYLTLQNCPNIFILNEKGDFIDIENKGNSDICGIDFHDNTLYFADKSRCAIFKGDNLFLQLSKDYHPFDISIYDDTLYCISSNLNKITSLRLNGFSKVMPMSINSNTTDI